MRTGLALSLAAVVAGNAQAAKDVAVPLTPSGKWAVEYEKNQCALSRKFGGGPGGEVSLGIRPATLSDLASIVVIVPTGFATRRNAVAAAHIVLAPSGRTIEIKHETEGAIPSGGRGAILSISRSDMAAVFAAKSLTIEAGEIAVTLAPSAGPAAATALQACETQLIARWGLDPTEIAKVTTPAEGRAVSFVSTDDYPAQSLKRQSVGVTNILFRIGTDGRLSDCRLLESSGDPDLDQATCSLFLKRGSFKPARNRNGDPIATWKTYKVNWRLPA